MIPQPLTNNHPVPDSPPTGECSSPALPLPESGLALGLALMVGCSSSNVVQVLGPRPPGALPSPIRSLLERS